MCGIAGIAGDGTTEHLEAMLSQLVHRGPDEQGTFVDESANVMMGTRRLSIVDLSNGSQPISNEDGTVTVSFNGEIYNYQSLKETLTDRGHTFATDCDTEVLVHLWEEYGEEMTSQLEGMFAFSIWDASSETLFLARDRIGIKPLFVYAGDDRFVWASEIAAILAADVEASVDPKALYQYFSFKYTAYPNTLLDSIEKVPPGTAMTVRDGNVSTTRYWSVDQTRTRDSLGTSADTVRDLLERSIEQRLMGDVPVSAFLSGGLDSSSVVALATEFTDDLNTYSAVFDDSSVDESEEAKAVAAELGTNHHEVQIDLSSMDVFSDMVRYYGEPLADPAILPTLLLAKKTSEDRKVVLTGEGADELFGGYDYYRMISNHHRILNKFPGRSLEALRSLEPYLGSYDKHIRYLSSFSDSQSMVIECARDYDEPPERYLTTSVDEPLAEIRAEIPADSEPMQSLTAFDIRHKLPDKLLYKVDHATMASSLEARVPFLDHRLVQYASSIPTETKLNAGPYKPVLRKAVSDIVPDRVLQRDKHGFKVPVGAWFRQRHDGIEAWLSEEKLSATPYLDPEVVFDIWDAHRAEKVNQRKFLWKTLNYVAWYHTHLQDGY